MAARADRLLGLLARPTLAFSVADRLPFLLAALEQALAGRLSQGKPPSGEGH